jgi:hypothetical protein
VAAQAPPKLCWMVVGCFFIVKKNRFQIPSVASVVDSSVYFFVWLHRSIPVDYVSGTFYLASAHVI